MSEAAQHYSVIAMVISALALLVSLATAWLTLLHRGVVKMTQPTVIFFGPDGPREAGEEQFPKIFLRTLLFSTSKRGRIIENMFVALSCDDIRRDFNVWVYGPRNELVRGSGLFVGETGVEANHHFLISRGGEPFQFISGKYRLDVYVHLLGDHKRTLLFSQTLAVSSAQADIIGENRVGLYFDWDPDKKRYDSHMREEPKSFWEQ